MLNEFRTQLRPAIIDPSLILRVQLDPKTKIPEDVWRRCGIVLLSVDENNTLVLFSSDNELTEFKKRLSMYIEGPSRPKQKNPPYAQIFACIDHIGEVRSQDRIGRLFRGEGIKTPEQFENEMDYIVCLLYTSRCV